jgi:diguanylate cyclase (GGDEF)-like protein
MDTGRASVRLVVICEPSHDRSDQRLGGLMDAVAARVWLADLRPAMAMAAEIADASGDLTTHLKAHPDRAREVYRNMVPLAWNAHAAEAYGLPERHPADLLAGIPADYHARVVDALGRVLSGEPSGVLEFRATDDGHQFIATRFSWAMVGPEGAPESETFLVSQEHGDLATEQAAAWERQEQVRVALAGSNTAIYMFDRDLRVAWVENPRTRRSVDFAGFDLVESFGAEAGAALEDAFRPIIRDGIPGGTTVEVTRDGVTRYFDFQAKPWRTPAGLISGLVGTNVEVTERERMLRDLARAASTDGLTGLSNRQALIVALDGLARMGGGGPPTALLAFDIPRFQTINDVYGHDVGDTCLRRVAEVLIGEAHEGDVVARMGGDEFALVVHGDRAASMAASESEALRIKGLIEEMVIAAIAGVGVRLQVVTGIASGGGDGHIRRTGAEILGDVDMALSQAKRTRQAVSLVEADAASYRERIRRRLDWGGRVRAALEGNELVVMAQPIVSLATGDTRAFELLVRLRDGDGVIPAAAFMPDIDLLGMTPLLDRWMARHAVELLARHADALGERHLAVNVSATTFTEGGLLEVLDAAAASSGADLTRLAVEMTETEALADIDAARDVIAGLHQRGCLFVLDDFGSGAAAPVYLTELPVDWLKVDGRFVRRAPHSSIDRAIVEGAVGVARAAGIPVVAEWIEDAEARSLMAAMGVELGQGFHFAAAGAVPEVFSRM